MPATLDVSVADARTAPSFIQWPSVWAGAFIAAAVSFVLLTFGSAIGLAVAPLTPSWRTQTMLFAILSGLWVLAIAIASTGLGGYVAGRTRSTWHVVHDREVEVRDGLHGLTMWALALTLSAALSALSAALFAAAPIAPGAIARSAAEGPVTYEVDRLFRPPQGAVVTPTPALREEASRALMAASSGVGFTADDRADLVRIVADTTRAPQDVAVARVDQSVAAVREKLRAARHAAIILAFITAASAAASAAMAWHAARVGGRHRDAVA